MKCDQCGAAVGHVMTCQVAVDGFLTHIRRLAHALELALADTGHGKKARAVSDMGGPCDSWVVGDEDYCNCWRKTARAALLNQPDPHAAGEGD